MPALNGPAMTMVANSLTDHPAHHPLVYVIVRGFAYEGIQSIAAVYTRLDLAEDALAELRDRTQSGPSYWYEIEEVKLDPVPTRENVPTT